MLKYATFAENDSLYNTPPVFSIYMVNKTLHWIKKQGGVEQIVANNVAKAKLIYDAIDNSNGFYIGHAEKEYRSLMNITFNLADKELEKGFYSSKPRPQALSASAVIDWSAAVVLLPIMLYP